MGDGERVFFAWLVFNTIFFADFYFPNYFAHKKFIKTEKMFCQELTFCKITEAKITIKNCYIKLGTPYPVVINGTLNYTLYPLAHHLWSSDVSPEIWIAWQKRPYKVEELTQCQCITDLHANTHSSTYTVYTNAFFCLKLTYFKDYREMDTWQVMMQEFGFQLTEKKKKLGFLILGINILYFLQSSTYFRNIFSSPQ